MNCRLLLFGHNETAPTTPAIASFQQQTSPNVSMLPNTNLAAKLPAVQHQPPRYFSVKDQHLLKPPHAMQSQGRPSGPPRRPRPAAPAARPRARPRQPPLSRCSVVVRAPRVGRRRARVARPRARLLPLRARPPRESSRPLAPSPPLPLTHASARRSRTAGPRRGPTTATRRRTRRPTPPTTATCAGALPAFRVAPFQSASRTSLCGYRTEDVQLEKNDRIYFGLFRALLAGLD